MVEVHLVSDSLIPHFLIANKFTNDLQNERNYKWNSYRIHF